jgi:integrase
MKFLFGKRAIEQLPVPSSGKRKIYRDTREQYLFLRCTPTGRTFYFQKTIKGSKVQVTIGKFPSTNVDTARKRCEQISADYTNGIDVAQEARESRSGITLGELYADYRVNRRRGQGRICKHGEYMWTRHFLPWTNKQPDEVSFNMARKLILGLRPEAPVYANRVQRFGKALFNHGINDLRLKIENPFTFAQVSEKGRSRKTYRLHRSDMPTFMKALDTLSPVMKSLFLTTLFSGRRIGECRSMQWADIDLDAGIWTIPDTKSGEPQVCVIPLVLIDILNDRQTDSESDWVFPANSKSGHVVAVNNSWSKVRKHGFEHLRVNDLRGTLASWLQEAGVPIIGASQQLGHGSVDVTARHYSSISNQVQRIGLDTATSAMIEAAAE